nr:hypothetical protein [Streptomyces sp. GbtcB6]
MENKNTPSADKQTSPMTRAFLSAQPLDLGLHEIADRTGLTEHEQPAADGEFGGKVEDMACRAVEILGQPLRIALPHKEDGPGLLGIAYLLVEARRRLPESRCAAPRVARRRR